MKAIFIFSIALFLAVFAFGQERDYNYIPSKVQKVVDVNPNAVFTKSTTAYSLDESFETAVPPTGWTKANPDGGTGWNRQTSGTTPMPGWQGGTIDVPTGGGNAVAYCTWTTGGASANDQWLITPQLSISTGDELVFWIRKFGAYLERLDVLVSTTNNQTASFTNTLEAIVWASDEGDEWVEYTYDLSTYNGQQIYIAFREHVTDNAGDGAALLLDLVKVGSATAFDLALTAITTPAISEQGELNITGTITCAGSTTHITSYDVTYNIDEGTESDIYSVSGIDIAPGSTHNFTHDVPYNFDTDGTYEINVTISNINGGDDDFADNNTSSKNINIVSGMIQRKPLHEVFTSSTCGFCPDANAAIDAVALSPANADDCTVIKYQVSWPGAGDPYTTPEIATRVSYYGVDGVPDFFVDANGDSGTAYTQAAFDDYAAVPAFFEIDATHTIEGSVVDVDVTITPSMNWTGKCRVAVIERTTYDNATTNGETEFHNVMMKMLPNVSGTDVTLVAGTPYNFSVNGDMAATFVEEMWDLDVVVFLQEDATKDVMQSNYSEFIPTETDVILSNLEVSNTYSDCSLGSAETVSIEVYNFGPDPISDITVSYTLDGNTPVEETFAGPIASMSSESYTFSQTANLSGMGLHTIEASISHDDDSNTTNNTATTSAISGDETINVAITFDNYPGETSWEILDQELDVVIASGSGYSTTGGTLDQDVCILSTHCYTFTIYDAYGDGICCNYGTGSYSITYQGLVVGTGGEFTDSESIEDICNVGIENTTDASFLIYPNPSSGNFTIMNVEKSNISIYNISGQLIKTINNANNLVEINTEKMAQGTYIIKVTNNNETMVKRVVLTK